MNTAAATPITTSATRASAATAATPARPAPAPTAPARPATTPAARAATAATPALIALARIAIARPASTLPDPGALNRTQHRQDSMADTAELPSPTDLDEAAELLRALASTVRIRIVLALQQGPRLVGELVSQLDVSQPLVSQHLKVLRSAGVVSSHRLAQAVSYQLVDEHLAHIVADAVTHVHERH